MEAQAERFPAAKRVLRASVLVAQGFAGEAITLRASALTYLTLFALVPALAVLFTVVEAAGGQKQIHDNIQRFINEQIGIGAGTAVADTLGSFVARAHVGTIGTIGFAALLVSVISLLWNIESAFNHIYAVKRPRKAVERLLKYWTFLTLGPIFLTASIALSWKIGELSGEHSHREQHNELLHALAALSSIGITYAGLTILYKVLPNARVRLRAAFSAALLSGSAWELAKLAFANLSSKMVQVHKIYGSLAALPIVLTWIYISWVITLIGCRFCYALEESRKVVPAPALRTAAAREAFVARLLVELVLQHREREAAVTASQLARALVVPTGLAREGLRALVASGAIHETREGRYLPARDPSRLTLGDARMAARATLRFPVDNPDELGQAIAAALRKADEQASASLSESIAHLIARVHPERPRAAQAAQDASLPLPAAPERSRP